MAVLKDKNKVSSIVKCKNGGYVWIGSCFISDIGYATEVFKSDSEGTILCRGCLDIEVYDNLVEMQIGHEKMCKKWGEKYE